jgi:hypothetical protein
MDEEPTMAAQDRDQDMPSQDYARATLADHAIFGPVRNACQAID